MSRQSGPFEVEKKLSAETQESCASQGNGPTTYSAPVSSSAAFNSSQYRPHLHRRMVQSQGNLLKLCSEKSYKSPPKASPKSIAEDLESLAAPERNYECGHYNTCLSLAAALNWESFSCGGCGGCVDKKLLWRAHHVLRKNNALKVICDLPILT